MNDIIEINSMDIGGNNIQTVNGRDLWKFLESSQQFADWIKSRVERGFFIEGEDYLIRKIMNNPNGGRPSNEYYISLTMAKKIGMMESSEKGNEVRDYFIECERRAKGVVPALPQTYIEALEELLVSKKENLLLEQKNLQLENKIEEDSDKVLLAGKLLNLGDKDGRVRPKDFAKAVEGAYQIGRNTLYQIMEDKKIWNSQRVPYARFQQNGMFKVELEPFTNHKTGYKGVSQIVYILPKGMVYLTKMVERLMNDDEMIP